MGTKSRAGKREQPASAIAGQLRFGKEDAKRLESALAKEGISSPRVMRDHRKRGRAYYSLIFEPAKTAPKEFGFEPFKMVNYRGIYVVDEASYRRTLREIEKLFSDHSKIEKFSEGKKHADAEMADVTAYLRTARGNHASPKELARAHREVKIIMGMIGEAASAKGLIKKREGIYRKTIPEIIKMANRLG